MAQQQIKTMNSVCPKQKGGRVRCRTSKLEGLALDWSLAVCLGLDFIVTTTGPYRKTRIAYRGEATGYDYWIFSPYYNKAQRLAVLQNVGPLSLTRLRARVFDCVGASTLIPRTIAGYVKLQAVSRLDQ